jgi:hypothetical protein
MLPGKKGILLRLDEWRAMAGAAPAIGAALAARDVRYCLQLSEKCVLVKSLLPAPRTFCVAWCQAAPQL